MDPLAANSTASRCLIYTIGQAGRLGMVPRSFVARFMLLCALCLGCFGIGSGAVQAIVPIGPPAESSIIYECSAIDDVPPGPDVPYVLNDDYVWIVLDKLAASESPFLGSFWWWHSKIDFINGSRFHAWRGFDFFGSATFHVIVGPDGAAEMRLAHAKEGVSRFVSYPLTCRKGGAYETAFDRVTRK